MTTNIKRTIKFKLGNKIAYGQDFNYWHGLPSNIEFTVEEIDENHAVLKGPGYGGKPYGNGKIYIYRSMNTKARELDGVK